MHIKTEPQLIAYCDRLRGCDILAFDTEFVSENRYRPQLCLVQIAVGGELALIDALAVKDLTPFWELITRGVRTPVVHAAREEFLFCLRGLGKSPPTLYDVQLVAGFVGIEFPVSLGNLVERLLGKQLDKVETRTDWRARPLSSRQLKYALQDVVYLERLYRKLDDQLRQLGRVEWFMEEQLRRQQEWALAETELQWQRLQGISKLSSRSLAIARQLFQWRDREAQKQERLPRRILPDDLLVEIAKRRCAEISALRDIRGLDYRINERYLAAICEQVRTALKLPEDQLPSQPDRGPAIQLGLLGQFLNTGVALVCAQQKLAPGLVATTQEIRELAAWRLGILPPDQIPALLRGWRGQVVGTWIDDLMQGKLGLRVLDPSSDHPIGLVPWPQVNSAISSEE